MRSHKMTGTLCRSVGSCVPVRKGDGGSRIWNARGYVHFWQFRLQRNKYGWRRFRGKKV